MLGMNVSKELLPIFSAESMSLSLLEFAFLHVNFFSSDYRRCRANRGSKGRNYAWSHVHNHHILLMPDKWEFPWVIVASYFSPYLLEFGSGFLDSKH